MKDFFMKIGFNNKLVMVLIIETNGGNYQYANQENWPKTHFN